MECSHVCLFTRKSKPLSFFTQMSRDMSEILLAVRIVLTFVDAIPTPSYLKKKTVALRWTSNVDSEREATENPIIIIIITF